MTPTTVLLRRHMKIQRTLPHAAACDAAHCDVCTALEATIVAFVAVETQVLLPAAEAVAPHAVRACRSSHERLGDVVVRHLQPPRNRLRRSAPALSSALRAHAMDLAPLLRALEERLSQAEMFTLGRRMESFGASLLLAPTLEPLEVVGHLARGAAWPVRTARSA